MFQIVLKDEPKHSGINVDGGLISGDETEPVIVTEKLWLERMEDLPALIRCLNTAFSRILDKKVSFDCIVVCLLVIIESGGVRVGFFEEWFN